jgi:hypothetical protein
VSLGDLSGRIGAGARDLLPADDQVDAHRDEREGEQEADPTRLPQPLNSSLKAKTLA